MDYWMRIGNNNFYHEPKIRELFFDSLKKQQLKQTTKNVSKFLKNLTKKLL